MKKIGILGVSLLLLGQLLSAQTVMKITAPAGTEGYFNLLTEVYAQMGYKAQITVLPPERGLMETNAGNYDAYLGSALNLLSPYPNLTPTKEPLVEVTIQGWVKKGSSIILAGLDDLKKYTLGQVRGAKSTEGLIASLKLTAENADSLDTLARMLNASRFEVALVPSILPTLPLESVGTLVAPKLFSQQTFHLLNVKHTALSVKFDTVLRSLKADGTFQKLISGK